MLAVLHNAKTAKFPLKTDASRALRVHRLRVHQPVRAHRAHRRPENSASTDLPLKQWTCPVVTKAQKDHVD